MNETFFKQSIKEEFYSKYILQPDFWKILKAIRREISAYLSSGKQAATAIHQV